MNIMATMMQFMQVCAFLRILSETNFLYSEFLSDVPITYITPEIRVDCADEKNFRWWKRKTALRGQVSD